MIADIQQEKLLGKKNVTGKRKAFNSIPGKKFNFTEMSVKVQVHVFFKKLLLIQQEI